MKKEVLNQAVGATKTSTRKALQLVYDTLNQGQQKKLLKEEAVKELFDHYGVVYEQEE